MLVFTTHSESFKLLRMRTLLALFFIMLASTSFALAKVVVFFQPGFPTVESEPLSRATLDRALDGMAPVFVDLQALKESSSLSDAELLVLPYGSSVPTDAWPSIHALVEHGGSLLILGGQPLRVPVTQSQGKFQEAVPQDPYSRELDFRHTYELPSQAGAKFAWKHGYAFAQTPEVRGRKFFAVEGHLDRLG